MRIFNSDYHPSEREMRAILRKADLESHGYTKEVTTALTSKPGNNTTFFEKKHLYYKTVDCSRASEVVQELETLLSGNSFFLSSFSNLTRTSSKTLDHSHRVALKDTNIIPPRRSKFQA